MIIYLDTETTSLHPGQVCQLSYIIQDGKSESAKNFFFTVDSVDFSAFMVHGFSAEKLVKLSNGKRFLDHADEIEKDFNRADVLVCHNTAFDFMFMRAEFERVGKIFCAKNEFCSMKKSTPICKLLRSNGKAYKYPKLAELCKYFDIEDWQIKNKSEKLFGSRADYHDARFDTTALYLAVNEGLKCEKEFDCLKKWL